MDLETRDLLEREFIENAQSASNVHDTLFEKYAWVEDYHKEIFIEVFKALNDAVIEAHKDEFTI